MVRELEPHIGDLLCKDIYVGHPHPLFVAPLPAVLKQELLHIGAAGSVELKVTGVFKFIKEHLALGDAVIGVFLDREAHKR